MVKQCIYLVILMYFMHIFTFYDLGINYRFCRISEFFVDTTRNVNYKEKQNSEKIERVKITLNLKQTT